MEPTGKARAESLAGSTPAGSPRRPTCTGSGWFGIVWKRGLTCPRQPSSLTHHHLYTQAAASVTHCNSLSCCITVMKTKLLIGQDNEPTPLTT